MARKSLVTLDKKGKNICTNLTLINLLGSHLHKKNHFLLTKK